MTRLGILAVFYWPDNDPAFIDALSEELTELGLSPVWKRDAPLDIPETRHRVRCEVYPGLAEKVLGVFAGVGEAGKDVGIFLAASAPTITPEDEKTT